MVRRAVFLLALLAGGVSCSGRPEATVTPAPPGPGPRADAASASTAPASASTAPLAPEPALVREPATAAASDPALSRERDPVTAAMISVSYHARFGLPRGLARTAVLELPKAVEILKEAPAIERSRAIARLYAMRPPLAPDLLQQRERALTSLGVPAQHLKSKLGTLGDPITSDQVRAVADAALGVAKSACGVEDLKSVGEVTHGIIAVKTTLTVARPLDELRKVVDPQNWDCCGNAYFSQACIPEEDEDGFVFLPGSVAPVCAVSTSAKPLPKPGSAWARPLYERFRVGVDGLDVVYFNTIIDISSTSKPSDPNHVVTFSLNRSLGGAIAWSKGTCDIDEGGVTLTPQGGGRVKVEVTKRLRLQFATPEETELWSRVTAVTMPLAGDSLETSICCDQGQCKHP